MKRVRKILLFLLCFYFVNYSFSEAQTTGYSDSFDGEPKVTAPSSFGILQENSVLTIQVRKESSKKWQSIVYDIGRSINISENPFVNLRLKSDSPMLLTVHITDVFFAEMTKNIKIYPSEQFVNYFVDFRGQSGVNKSAITKIKLSPNGNSLSAFNAVLKMDELKIGSDANLFAGISAVDKQKVFVNSISNKFILKDIVNSDNIIITETSAIRNINISDIVNNSSTVTYDCFNNFIGTDTLTVFVYGKEGYSNNSIQVPIEVEGNNPPTINDIVNIDAIDGDTSTIELNGISDGNSTVEQPLIIRATSNNQDALPDSNVVIFYEKGLSVATLYLKTVKAASDIIVDVTIDDQFGNRSIVSKNFFVNSYSQYNYPPTIDNVPDQLVYIEDVEASVLLTGISSGDSVNQTLTFSVSSSNNIVVPTNSLSIDFVQGDSLAKLKFIPQSIGSSIITVTLQDNGGTSFNNGNAQTTISFNIEVGLLPQTGHVADFTSFDNWGLDYHNGEQDYEQGSFKGKQNVLKITLNNKICWTGTVYNTPELNLDKHRYLSYEIYFEGDDFGLGIGGRTHCYFYDDGWDPDIDRNLPAAHSKRKAVEEGKWATVFMDFRDEGGMDNNNGDEINVARIQKVLLNYASKFTWPFPSDNGFVYITNLRIGNAVPDSLIPAITPTCTILPVPNQTEFVNESAKTIKLFGVSSGSDNSVTPIISAVSSDTNFISNPFVSTVQNDGTATLTYTHALTPGRAMITVTVSAEGSFDKKISFYINIVEDDLSRTVDIELFRDSLYQTIRGFGTFYFQDKPNYIDFYADELGASAVRIGIISNQVEPVNDNDDPEILNLEAFNFDAFDFEYIKELKNKGVQTFILTSWSPPAWMKENLSVDYGYTDAPNYSLTDNKLEEHYFNEFAESMVAVVKMFKIKADVDLYAIGIQNEPAFNEPYPSAILDPAAFAILAGIVGKRFEKENITTKLYMPEQVFSQEHYSMSEYISAIKAKPEAEKYVDIIATHGYGTDGIEPGQPSYPKWNSLWNQSKNSINLKELWMTETNPESNSWEDALSLAGAIYGALKYGNISLWTLWEIEGTLLKVGSKLPSFYTAQNYYKFIRPGSRRIKVESENEDVLPVSFWDDNNNLVTNVIINKNQLPVTIRLLARTATIPAEYDIFTSAKYLNFEKTGTIGVNETLALPGKSVTTLVGRTDGEMVLKVDDKKIVPTAYVLYNNYPNPFNPTTTIKYSLKKTSDVKLFIYDILGREIKRLVDTKQNAGTYQVIFNAANYASGVYFYRLLTEEFSETKKIILLK